MGKQQKAVLGRGLGSLITMDDLNTGGSSSINEIELSKITPNPNQPRKEFDEEALEELTDSIKSVGLVTPITVRETGPDAYEIIAGERRYRAAKKAGLSTVPAYIRKVSDEKIVLMALVENLQRENLNPIETALGYHAAMELGQWTQEQLSKETGKKRATIANHLRLLNLPTEIQMGLRDRKIDMGHAKLLLSLDDDSTQLMIYEQIVEYDYTVRETEKIIHTLNEANEPSSSSTPTTKKPTDKIGEYQLLKKHFSDFFQSKVKFNMNEKGVGKITIPFTSQEDLERIVQLLDGVKKLQQLEPAVSLN